MYKTTSDKRPRCVAYKHPSMGTLSTCGKIADWLVHNLPNSTNDKYGGKPLCRDCIAKALINAGDAIDNVTFDAILIVKD